ncbi:hypothetical protein [Zoogloea sp.]|uniref:hypothetical protein n=1 Tax=Zoogloea sp. TaxID=49181 RepID=UPI002C918684|nr:hypothetical protein [Zoogloea sp.]HQA12119.1 hypothetical protein [Zoogloea sp.]
MSTPSSADTFAPLDDIDPATPGDPFTRLHYHYGQLLGAEDFNTEQRYFLLRSRLHNAVLHGFGTVWGLKIGYVDTETALRLTCDAGLAIDALGREIHVPQKICLDVTGLASTRFWADLAPPPAKAPAAATPTDVDTPASDDTGTPPIVVTPSDTTTDDPRRRVYVVLRYRACLTELAPAVVQPCSDQDAALAPSRVTDGYRLCLEAAPPDGAGLPIRDIALRPAPSADPRERLLDLILNPPTDLARLWSGADDAPLLLAVLDLEAVGTPAERVKLSGAIDNGVRALLPHVQAVADLALGIHLESTAGQRAFQATGVSAAVGTGADASRMVLAVSTSQPVLPASLGDASVRVLRFDAASKKWVEPAVTARVATVGGLSVTVDETWADPTSYQVCLAGTGAAALLSDANAPLAGAAGEAVPAGTGRDACLFATYPPITAA